MNERSIISVRGVSKYFGAVHAVDNVDLEILRGESFPLLWPSDRCIQTLLRILAGLFMLHEDALFTAHLLLPTTPPVAVAVHIRLVGVRVVGPGVTDIAHAVAIHVRLVGVRDGRPVVPGSL